ncbi:PEP-CTERM sorting domain-containing protein [Microcoleus sp. S36b_A4]|uniref:PEP-CTERM sorting domain-containing protein n=1 Tax=Microcoleus sp. S36b_A4 TaxID=3055420 RepID=UPI002FD25924
MGFPVKLFTIESNLIFMKNHYHKVAVASVCTALGFALGSNTEAKAATFTLAPAITFEVIDFNYYGNSFDGLGDEVFPGNFDVVVRGTDGEAAEFAEFNINSLFLDSNTVISSAVLLAEIYTFQTFGLGVSATNPGSLGIFGYVGNGTVEASDFEAGVFLSSVDISSSSPGDILSFDVTPFVNQRVTNGDTFAGFGIRALNLGSLTLGGGNFPGIQPRLIVETADVGEPECVPEPITIFGSALGLSLGGWLKRKKSNQQHKTTPQG